MWPDRRPLDLLGIVRHIVEPAIVRASILALNLAAAAIAVLVVLLVAASPSFGQTDRLDPALVLEDGGDDFCGHCHGRIYRAWRETQHSKTYKSLHRRKLAKQIAQRLGVKRIKSGWQCTKCHFTPVVKGGRIRPIAGVGCEACHGASANWQRVHAQYRTRETPAETETRYKRSDAAGMIRGQHLYRTARNCMGCHAVADERLIDIGGHPIGDGFEYVSWSLGEVRHNTQYSDQNDAPPAARQRMMFIVGKGVQLEVALRALAEVRGKDGPYAAAMTGRAEAAISALRKIAQAIGAPEIEQLIAVVEPVPGRGHKPAPATAATSVSRLIQRFANTYDGNEFAAIDAFIPGPDAYRGKVPVGAR